MTGFPNAFAWRAACAADAVLATWAGPWAVCFAIKSGSDATIFNFVEGQVAADPGSPAFILAAPEAIWARFLEPVPPRHHHGIFAMMYRLPEFSIQGDELVFMQHAHVARRVLEVGKWLALGRSLPVPVSLHPRGGARGVPAVTGRYVPVTVGGVTYQIYSESAGSGQDVLCMHTAGADGRQFHGLMADPRIVEHHRLISFDLPWHGKSPPPEGAIQGSWRLNTDLYVALIMGFIAAAGPQKPVALGASMSGEICLELAYRHPDSFAGIIACEACDKINQRQTVWAAHPHVNQAQFVPEWIRALSAPRSPANTWNRSHGTMARVARRCSLATSPSTPASGMPGNASGVSIPTGARFLC